MVLHWTELLTLLLLELLITAERVLRCFRKQRLVNANPFHCLKSQCKNIKQLKHGSQGKQGMQKKVDGWMHGRTDARTDARTAWVTPSLLELLIAAKNMSTQGVRRSMEKQGKYAKNKILGTDARTAWVTVSLLELLIAAKNRLTFEKWKKKQVCLKILFRPFQVFSRLKSFDF